MPPAVSRHGMVPGVGARVVVRRAGIPPRRRRRSSQARHSMSGIAVRGTSAMDPYLSFWRQEGLM